MKTAPLFICITSLLFASCEKQSDDPNTDKRDPNSPREDQSGFILTTDLPEAMLCGTPKPVRLPRRTPGYNW